MNRLSPSTMMLLSVALLSLSVWVLGSRLTRVERETFDFKQRLRALSE